MNQFTAVSTVPKVCILFETDCRVTKQQAYARYQSTAQYILQHYSAVKTKMNQEKTSPNICANVWSVWFTRRVVHLIK